MRELQVQSINGKTDMRTQEYFLCPIALATPLITQI